MSQKLNFKKYRLLLAIGTMVVMAGCVHEPFAINEEFTNGTTKDTDTTGVGKAGCDPDSVYFDNDILPLLMSSCAKSGCHDAATAEDGVRLDNYNNIMQTGDVRPLRPYDSKIYENIMETDPEKRMPPDGNTPLTAYQKELVRKWIAQGALNNRCNDGCDTTNVTFSGSIMPLISQKCAGCHSGSNPQGGIDLTNYNNVLPKVTDGSLESAVNHSTGFTAMPYGGNKLPDCEIRQIQIWIENGAKND